MIEAIGMFWAWLGRVFSTADHATRAVEELAITAEYAGHAFRLEQQREHMERITVAEAKLAKVQASGKKAPAKKKSPAR